MSDKDLRFHREVLLVAIREVAATANDTAQRGGDPAPLRAEAQRLSGRLVRVQEQLGEHDND